MTIREQILLSLYEQAINTLVDRKHQLDDDFAHGIINYAEYEQHKWLINNELEPFVFDLIYNAPFLFPKDRQMYNKS